MIEVIIGEVLTAGTVIVIGALHYANSIYKRFVSNDKPIVKDYRSEALIHERNFLEDIAKKTSFQSERETISKRIAEITKELTNIDKTNWNNSK